MLQARAQSFLARKIPTTVDYVRDSLAERFLATYAKHGSLPGGPESAELIELAAMEAGARARDSTDPEAAEYFQECAGILEAILADFD